jgi:hypothetical protein
LRAILEAFIDCASGSSLAALRRRCWIDCPTYVEGYFPSPSFRTLAACKRDYGRMTRRLRDLLGEAAGTEATIDHWGTFVLLTSELVQSGYLRVTEDGEGIELAFSPADTLTQARVFYRRVEIVTAVKALAELPGWGVYPNFHFGYWTRGLCWTRGDIGLNDYIDLWSLRIAEGVHPVGPSGRDDYWEELVRLRVVDPDDRPEFDRCFRNRPEATPRPGLRASRRWSIPEAERLDAAGQFIDQVGQALSTTLETCRTTVRGSSSASTR